MPERVVRVEILGQHYPIRSDLDEAYLHELAAYVDQKMRAAAAATPGGDWVRLAIVAALNAADELFRCRSGEDWGAHNRLIAERAQRIADVLDSAL